jgi:hypothetical protein
MFEYEEHVSTAACKTAPPPPERAAPAAAPRTMRTRGTRAAAPSSRFANTTAKAAEERKSKMAANSVPVTRARGSTGIRSRVAPSRAPPVVAQRVESYSPPVDESEALAR